MVTTVHSWVNNTVNISCNVDSNPPATLEWLKEGEPVQNSELDITVNTEGQHSSLQVMLYINYHLHVRHHLQRCHILPLSKSK